MRVNSYKLLMIKWPGVVVINGSCYLMKLPQFSSLEEAKSYYSKYGKLVYFGRAGRHYEYCVYNYYVRDGRVLKLNIHDNGKVELRE